MSRSYRIDSPDGAEAVGVVIGAPTDPTGETVEFGLVASGSSARPTSWTDGTWGTWVAASGTAPAVTPTFGALGDVAVTGGAKYELWVRATDGTETVEKVVGVLDVGQ